MSSAGGDPDEYSTGNQPDGSYYNPFPDSSPAGLFGGQYADMQASAPAGIPGLDATALGLDDTGLPPSVTVAPNLTQQVAAGPAGSSIPAPFNLYDWLHNYLNQPGPSQALQDAQDWARSFEDNGNKAAAVGGTGVLVGAAIANPLVALGSGGLFGLGALANGAGKVLDAGSSFLKSVQQDNNQPLKAFGLRAVEPDFTDLEIPKFP